MRGEEPVACKDGFRLRLTHPEPPTIGSTVTADYTYDGLERLAVRTTQNMTPAGTTHYVYDLAALDRQIAGRRHLGDYGSHESFSFAT